MHGFTGGGRGIRCSGDEGIGRLSMSHNGFGKRVVRAGLDTGKERQYFLAALLCEGSDVGDARLALGQGASFVESDGLHPANGFQGATAFDE